MDNTKKIIEVDSMMIESIQACPRQAAYRFLNHLGHKEKAIYLASGILIHYGLDGYYTAKKEDLDVMECIANGEDYMRRKYTEDTSLTSVGVEEFEWLVTTLKQYGIYYRNEDIKVIEVESPFSVKIYEDDEFIILLCGIIDLTYEDKNGVKVMDHKSMSRQTKYDRLRNQFVGYSRATNLDYIVCNGVGLQKTVEESKKFTRSYLRYNDEFRNEWVVDLNYSLREFVMYLEMNFFPRRFKGCTYCDFKVLCDAPIDLRPNKIKFMFVENKWDVFTRD